ncbi:MAG: zinc-dependent metalloprotease, partial [Actinomycetota bacterium]
RLPSAPRIAEAMARRRADAGPGDRMFQRFVGVEIPQEQLRNADAFCRAVLESGGWPALSRVWEDSDSLPTGEEIANPALWRERVLR